MNSNLAIKRNAAESILTVLIWSVTSLLSTRLFLKVMNYPEIGKGVWHISHALTGGLIMLMGMLTILIFKGKNVNKTSAAVFGVGLGWFVDETGKYLTRDYNYFFRPTIMIVYVFFILMFLLYIFIRKKSVGLRYLGVGKGQKWLRKLVSKKQLMWGLWLYSVYFSLEKIWETGNILASPKRLAMILDFYSSYSIDGKTDIYLISFKILSEVMAAILFLAGARYFWSKKRLRGIKLFQYGLYVNIFLVTVFKFYFEQFGAILDLLFGIGLLEILLQYKKEIVRK
jgi:hypothetical protein